MAIDKRESLENKPKTKKIRIVMGVKSSINVSSVPVVEKITPRLYIRSYTEGDYVNCLSIYSDPELTHFFDHGEPRSKAEIDTYLVERESHHFKKGIPFGLFSVFLKDQVTFIGQVDVVPTGEPGEVEIGWIFCKEFHCLGYCSEAVKSFLIPFVQNLAKEKVEISGKIINRIIATAHPKNEASKRIMTKAGLAFFKKDLRFGGKPRDWYELNLENQNG